MMDAINPVRERAIEKLRQIVLAALRDYDAEVWPFGSCARRDVRQHSDIDVGILPHVDLPIGFLSMLRADIEDSDIPYDIDLVDLGHTDPALLAEVRREGAAWRK